MASWPKYPTYFSPRPRPGVRRRNRTIVQSSPAAAPARSARDDGWSGGHRVRAQRQREGQGSLSSRGELQHGAALGAGGHAVQVETHSGFVRGPIAPGQVRSGHRHQPNRDVFPGAPVPEPR